jgi:hypothetical protein
MIRKNEAMNDERKDRMEESLDGGDAVNEEGLLAAEAASEAQEEPEEEPVEVDGEGEINEEEVPAEPPPDPEAAV